MKMILRKAVALLLTAALILSVAPLNMVYAAGEKAKVKLDDVEANITSESGVDIFVPVTLSDNIGFAAFDSVFKIPDEWSITAFNYLARNGQNTIFSKFDEDMGTYVPIDALTITATPANCSFIAVYAPSVDHDPNIMDNGIMLWAKVHVPADTVNGTYTVRMTANEIANAATENVTDSFEFIDSTVTVTGGIPVEDVTPVITTHPQSASYTYGDSAKALTVAASVKAPEGAKFTYQWYSNTTNSNENGTPISGQTSATYQPVLSGYGTAYYYCVVTNTYHGQAFTATSKVAAITYAKANQEIAFQNANTVTYGENLTLNASGGGGTGAVTYSVANGTGAATVEGSTLKPEKVGVVTVTAEKAADENYEKATATQEITIDPAELVLDGSASYDVTVYTTRNPVALTVPAVTAKNGQTVSSKWDKTSGSDSITLNSAGPVTVAATESAKDGDKATVTLTYSAPNHNDKVVTYSITVRDKKDMSDEMNFTAKDVSVTYDGTDKPVSTFVNAATVPETYTGTITYTVKDGTGTVVASGADLSTLSVRDAGTYTVTATYSDDENEGANTVTFTINRASVEKPTAVTGLVYNGSAQTGVIYKPGAGYAMDGTTQATDAGNYTVTATLDSNHQWNDSTTEPVTIQWSIAKAVIDVSGWTWNYTGPFTYDGKTHSVTLNDSDEKVSITYEENSKENAGTYTAVANLSVKADYQKNYALSHEKLTLAWEILKQSVTVNASWCATTSFEYDGNPHSVTVTGVDLDLVRVEYTGNVATNAGNYTATATFSALYPDNYTVTGTIAPLSWSITKAPVEKPTAKTGLTYNGQTQTGVNYQENAGYTMSGTVSAVNAGDYSAAAKLDDNHQWMDGSTEDVTVTWTIAKKTPDALEQAKSLRYSDTSEQTFAASDIMTLLNDANPETSITITGISTDSDLFAKAEVKDEGSVVYALKSGLTFANQTAKLTVAFRSNNYLDGTVTLNISLMDKNDVSGMISFENGSSPYTGLVQTYEKASMTDSTLTAGIRYAYSPEEVKNVGTYTVTATYEDADNYGTAAATFTITKAPLTITGAAVTPKEYDGKADAAITGVSFDGLVNGETLAIGTDYTVSNVRFTDVNAGIQSVSFLVDMLETSVTANYALKEAAGSASGVISAKKIVAALGSVEDQIYTGSAIEPSVPVTSNDTVDGYALVKDTDYQVSYESNINAGTAKILVKAKSGNYTFDEVQTTFTITKADPVVVANDMTVTYTGEAIPAETISGTATFNGAAISGAWSWVSEPDSTNASETPYEAKVRFTPDNENLNAVEETIQVTIEKATPSGEPAYTAITESGKTLADAALNVGTIEPAGTILWVDENGEALEETTEVERGVAYRWLFTPEDTANYNTLSGEITLYPKSETPVIPYVPGGSGSKPSTPVTGQTGFADVKPGDWYAEAVEMVVREGLFTGVSDSRFDPDGAMTRAMLVTVLWRLDGEPAAKGAAGFRDVVKGSWYAEAVAWANENGIVKGYNETTFGADDFVTREQMAAILYRYASYAGVSVSARADLSGYADLHELDAYAEAPMAWAVSEGLITGLSANRLSPNGNATRAQVATILMRFVENIRK